MPQKLVTIKTFFDSTDAHLCKGKLEAAGIKCFLKNDELVKDTMLHFTHGPIELVIREQDAKEAVEILKATPGL